MNIDQYRGPFEDPREVPSEFLRGVDISQQPLPCGLERCAALVADECLEGGTDRKIAVLSCARGMGISTVKAQLNQTRETNDALQAQSALDEELIKRLSVDNKTGLLTYNTQQALLEDMLSGGLMERMRRAGYVFELALFDLDRLTLHNKLGAHKGGDTALEVVATALQPLFRRRGDLVGYKQHFQEAQEAVGEGQGVRQLGRFDKGDEVIGISFIPPHQIEQKSGDRRKPLESLDIRLNKINQALVGVEAVYPLMTSMTKAKLAEEYGMIFDYTIDERGMVHAPVSGTFAVMLAPVPTNMLEFERLFQTADGAMMSAKTGRTEIATQGVVLNLLASKGTSNHS